MKRIIIISLLALKLTSCTERSNSNDVSIPIQNIYCIDTIILTDFTDIDSISDDNIAFVNINLSCNDSLTTEFNGYSFWALSEENDKISINNLALRGVEFSSTDKKYLRLQTEIFPSDTARNNLYQLVKNRSPNIIILSKIKNEPTIDFKIWTQKTK